MSNLPSSALGVVQRPSHEQLHIPVVDSLEQQLGVMDSNGPGLTIDTQALGCTKRSAVSKGQVPTGSQSIPYLALYHS